MVQKDGKSRDRFGILHQPDKEKIFEEKKLLAKGKTPKPLNPNKL